MNLLDLPLELRLKIYAHALPREVNIKNVQIDIHGDQEICFPDKAEVPRWMFANKQIKDESYELFWERVLLEFPGDGYYEHELPRPGTSVYVSPESTSLVKHLIFPAAMHISKHKHFKDDWSMPNFPSVERITLLISDDCLNAPQIQRLYFGMKKGLVDQTTGEKTEHSLGLLWSHWVQILRENVVGFPEDDELSDLGALGAHADELSSRYEVSFELPARLVEQDWLSMPAYGIVNNVHHRATMKLSYNWNIQTPSCTFDDISETVTRDVEGFDHNALGNGTPLPGASDGHQYPKLYLSAQQGVARKRRELSTMLIHQEMQRQGVVPMLDVQRGPKSVSDYYV